VRSLQNARTHSISTEVTVMNNLDSIRSPLLALFFAIALSPFGNGDTAGDANSRETVVPAVVKPSKVVSSGFEFLKSERFEAYKASLEKSSLISIFHKGGPIMWPLLCASVLALGTVIDRLFFLFVQRCQRDRKGLRRFLEALHRSDMETAKQISKKSRYYVLRVLEYALAHKDQSLSSALLYAKERELKRFRGGIPILDTVITLAPLLGLLGTVTGMMGSFSLIGGELSAPGAITGGIAEALIATAFGLGIAITSLLPFNYLNTKMDEARQEIESAAAQMELLLQSQSGVVSSTRSARTSRSTPSVTETQLVGCNG